MAKYAPWIKTGKGHITEIDHREQYTFGSGESRVIIEKVSTKKIHEKPRDGDLINLCRWRFEKVAELTPVNEEVLTNLGEAIAFIRADPQYQMWNCPSGI
jgi:hypothetical protein